MGQIGSILSTLNTVNRVVGTARDLSGAADNARLRDLRAQQNQALTQLQQRSSQEEALAQTRRDRDLSLLNAENAADERRRLNTLSAQSARARAQLSGAGVGSSDGSGAQVLGGLLARSDEERTGREDIRRIRERIINESFDALQARNLLEIEQLRARQSLRRQLI